MDPAHKNIQLLIAHKEQELKTLKEEWRQASYIPQDIDYEYLAVLYPIIAEIERELEKFRKLAGGEFSGESHFPAYIRQLLKGECDSLQLHIELKKWSYRHYKGPMMTFERMKQKYALNVKLPRHNYLDGYLHDGNFRQLSKLGWKKEGKQGFRLKHLIRTEEDLTQFHQLIACTLIEPLAYLIQEAKETHFVVIPVTGS